MPMGKTRIMWPKGSQPCDFQADSFDEKIEVRDRFLPNSIVLDNAQIDGLLFEINSLPSASCISL